MLESAIPLSRAWNSWDSEHPAEMSYLPLGIRLTPCAYASSANDFTRFPAGKGVMLGPRALDGNGVGLSLAHAGTSLALSYDKPDPLTLRGHWEAQHLAEWGLRFWVVLVLRWTPPGTDQVVEWRYDSKSGELAATSGSHAVAIRGERLPLLATFHDSLDALQREYETKGYFCLDSRGERGRVAVLRYHLEEMPRFTFAAAIADDKRTASARASAVLSSAPIAPLRPLQTGRHAGALDAVRDVIGWNTVWDGANRRPYTSLSRNWVAQKFGGWGVWLNDVLYHGLMAGLFDAEIARENLAAVFAGATPAGNLPCLLTGRDSWVDRSQPPIGTFIVWMLYLRTRDKRLLSDSYAVLARNHDWWWQTRDGNGDGLVEYGTSPVGEGLYCGTKLAAKDESSMDNSPTHDEATLRTDVWTLDCADVGLNSLLALDGEMLANMARALGNESEAERFGSRAESLKARIRERLWDGERRVFANRLWSGKFTASLAPTSFYPLLAGAASEEQVRAMLPLLNDVSKFGGTWRLPSCTRDDPAFPDNVYWRGRVWPPLNFLVWHGLKRYGFDAEAADLADNSYRLFQGEWARRNCPENYNAVTGEALDQPDTDSFYGWGALMPTMAVGEVTDVNPWNGWEITHGAGDTTVGPLLTPVGPAFVQSVAAWMKVIVDSDTILQATVPGRYRHIELGKRAIRLVLPPIPIADDRKRWLAFPQVPRERVAAARLGGQLLTPELTEEGAIGSYFRLPPTTEPQPFELQLS
jgi:mannosylglycerate hydrolase MGH1-like protein